MAREQAEAAGPVDAFRQFFGLQRDVLVLSLAMFAFSLGFQMTSRFLPEYVLDYREYREPTRLSSGVPNPRACPNASPSAREPTSSRR